MGGGAPSPDALTREEFDALLAQYPPLVESISKAKGSKPGQKTLQELDRFRYVDAPAAFGAHDDHRNSNDNSNKPARAMTLDDVKLLVEWKLRHGKFRPTLMSLVSSNPAPLVSSTISSAVSAYRSSLPPPSSSSCSLPSSSSSSSPPPAPTYPSTSGAPPPAPAAATAGALLALCSLRGVGPATASLLLSVHDPRRAPFFSDEAFLWLCAGANPRAPIKYVEKEYRALRERAAEVAARLGVSALDLEKVAYVVMKGSGDDGAGAKEKVSKKTATRGEAKVEKPPVKRKSILKEVEKDIGKGKDAPTTAEPGVRRSKRLKS
ncbi:hypothetical protein Purlil1_3770 [Purpureocillium lilacinum]|uniref:Uncharacterized protein n=1 Tax=Purpureocillium lilacinum TaxID=33203 RepID=A0ABR0C6D7_PURLI|nr:hypothetical protein Purlil1_3770 [Purpureocillium lilacinum]